MTYVLTIDMSNKTDSHSSSSKTITQKRPVSAHMQDYIDIYKEAKAREWNLIGNEFEFVLNDIPLKENTKGNGVCSLNG